MIMDALLVIFFVLMNAFFVIAEFSMVKVRRSQIEILASDGYRGAKYAQKVVNDLNSYLSACQLGITIASLALGWLGEPVVSALIGPFLEYIGLDEGTIRTVSIVVGFLIITMLHIVLGELVPKSLAIINSEKFAIATAMPLVLFYKATYPIMWLFNGLTNGLLKLMGYPTAAGGHETAHSDEEIQMLVEESYKHGLINKTEYTYVDNIFEATDKVVRDVMMPRPDMVCLFRGDPAEKMIETAIREKYTRYPVCDGNRDNVVGFINIRDVYEKRIQSNPFTVEGLVRPIITVPDSMPINDLLKKFQKEKENIAVVIDEYGGTAGLVTMEDILEEIVGSLCDEYDDEEKEIETIDESTFLVKGLVDLDKICDITGVALPSDEYDTLNGFLIAKMGRIPTVKERPVIQHEGLQFTIEKMTKNRILSIRIAKLPPSEPEHGEEADSNA